MFFSCFTDDINQGPETKTHCEWLSLEDRPGQESFVQLQEVLLQLTLLGGREGKGWATGLWDQARSL